MRCSHVSLHLLRFAEPCDSDEIGELAPPPDTDLWMAMVDVSLGENVLAPRIGTDWAVLGLHTTAEAAHAVIDGPSDVLPGDAVEAWHGAFTVIAHRGEVDWFDPGAPGPALVPVDEDPGGTLAVMTTAGYVIGPDFDLARAQAFTNRVDQVRPVLRNAPGNQLAAVFNGRTPMSPDGITFTVWETDEAMRDAAYRPGDHRDVIDWYRAEHNPDRTSFTRLRPLAHTGSWDGADPFAA